MKNLLLTLSLLLILSASAFATDTRVITMGDNNNILKDDANIWLYPSQIGFYPDMAVAEVCWSDDYYYDSKDPLDEIYTNAVNSFGVHFKFGEDNPHVLGLYLHNDEPLYSMFAPVSPPGHGPYDLYYYDSYSNKRVDLFYGHRLGENDLGLHIGYVSSSWEEDDEDDLDKRSFSQLSVGAGVTLMQGQMDLAVGYERYGFEDIDDYVQGEGTGDDVWVGVHDYEDDGNSTFYFRGRYFREINPKVTVVPHLSFVKGSYKWLDHDWDDNPGDVKDSNMVYRTVDASLTDMDLGIGMHYSPATNVLTVVDLGFRSLKLKDERTYDSTGVSGHMTEYSTQQEDVYTVLPYIKVGFEADVFKWMDLRFGATSYWTKHTDEYEYVGINPVTDPTVDKDIEEYPFNRTYLGLGFHWNRLHVDCYTDPEVFLNGFDFISGDGDGEMFFQISALYEMF